MSEAKIAAPPWYENWALQWAVLVVLFGISFGFWKLLPTPETAPHPLLTQLYVTLGEHLHQGLGFVLPSQSPYAPAAEQVSPLFPLLVASVMAVLGKGWPHAAEAMGWVQFVLLCFTLLMVFLFGRERIKTRHALLLTVWVMLLPPVWGAVHGLSPQLLFLGCSLTALKVIDKYFATTGENIKPGQVLHCSAWVTASVLANVPQGMLLMVAFVGLTFIKLGFKRGMNATLGMLLVLSPWVLYSLSRHPEIIQQTFTQLEAALWPTHATAQFQSTPLGIAHLGSTVEWLLAHAIHGLWGETGLQALPIVGPQLPDATWAWAAWGPLRWLVGGLLLLGVLAGFNLFSGVGSAYMLLTMVAAVVGFQTDILASPALVPLVAFYLLVGIRWLIRGLKEVQLAPLGTAALVVSTTLVVLHCLTVIGRSVNHPVPQSMDAWQHATHWLASHTEGHHPISTRQPVLVRLFAQRPALLSISPMDANLRAAERKLVSYKLLEPAAVSSSEARWRPNPQRVPLVYQHEGIEVWAMPTRPLHALK